MAWASIGGAVVGSVVNNVLGGGGGGASGQARHRLILLHNTGHSLHRK